MKNKLQSSIDVIFEIETDKSTLEEALHEYTYLADGRLIASVEVIITTVSGEQLRVNVLDWNFEVLDLVDENREGLAG